MQDQNDTPDLGETKKQIALLRRRHQWLAQQHAEAKARVREYQQRPHLTQREQLECRALQRLKLSKKDALAAVEQELSVLEAQLSDG